MKSLFLKIFLWFWTAFAIVAMALVVIVTITRSNTRMQAAVSIYLPFEARQAVDMYEREGKPALQHHFDHLAEEGFAEPYLLDEDWKDVLGRRLPMKAVEFGKSARRDTPLVDKFHGWKVIAAQQIVGDSGRKYTILVIIERPPIVGLVSDLDYRTLLGLLVIYAVGTFSCFWFARHITQPIVKLSEAAGQIADGSLDTRSGQSIRLRRDEIGRLSASFDRMAERIESLVHGQQRLFGDVSHELRSPLARLSVAEGLLRQAPPEEQVEYLDRIALEVDHIDHLIGQLLTLARIDSGADSSRTETLELSSLIQEVAVDGNFEAQAKRCSVKVDFMDICMTSCVREQLRRAIENVVRNAIRHTQPGTDVQIALHKQSALSKAEIHVRDHGPGVSSDHLEKIFFPFYRIPAGKNDATGGAGLGLAITERVIRMHGGKVSAVNAPAGGLIVKLELPLIEGE
ncbi:ATP-binding protein [Silvibacterium dinghuense]|uniref:histidine kinase n=1 Tax=Silvibacterium dinghuense TaxID=1560006 RepID=A0A4Q1S810_9BACT|nr:ATP-binding protein [Silvibacterium dinghuense]RXS92993.1 HAMP domain-containing protein [Silvibacterium dinghuense]GGG90361.1 two-component sensor histidine kinase [Silvibacterium dinghuense]